MSQFTDWLPYTHKVMGHIDGMTVPLPFNLTTLHALLPGAAHALERRLVEEVGGGGRIPVLALLEHDDPALRSLGEFVYEKVFLHYTMKQWGFRPEEIDRSVTGRVPVVVSHDDRYFHDRHQGIPIDGYTALVARMLDRPGITVETGVDFRDVVDAVSYDRMVYTGPIDEFFHLSHGPLPYRSLRFEHSTVGVDRFQSAAVVNFPDRSPYTRIIEHAQFSDQHLGRTTVTYEFPEPYERGRNEPYYPLPQSEHRRRYALYAADAAELRGRVVFSGRLAEYKYYDMDQAVAHALTVFRNQIADGPRDRSARVGTGAAP
jgi:UDP-galactopyranose mutase